MDKTFCTIITSDHLPRALALFESIKKYDPSCTLIILIADDLAEVSTGSLRESIKIIPIEVLRPYRLTNELFTKYAHFDIDAFRWSLKPILMSYLLESGYDKVLYIDCDMYFFGDYSFLFKELDQHAILLTPNWINADPLYDKDSFFSLLTSGLFSAGFIGANRDGLEALRWWSAACHFMIGDQVAQGIRGDQKYLDVLPVKFEGTKIIRHRGCNIGSWNVKESKRELVNGKVLINGQFPIIFVHFDNTLVQEILRGHDELLRPYLTEYRSVFEQSGYKLETFLPSIPTHTNPGTLQKMKWRLQLRTRLKAALYRLSQKL